MFGSHLSIAGGLENAIVEAQALGLQTVQIFTRNQQQWQAKELSPEQIVQFRHAVQTSGFSKIVAHDSYLINLAASNQELRTKIIAALIREIKRCDALGITYLVTHGGSHGGDGEKQGLTRMIASLDEAFAATAGVAVTLCLETTAGQGNSLGWRFEHLAEIIHGVQNSARLGVCLDTCHILAAGYDITTQAGTVQVFAEFEKVIGMQRLCVMHLNDSLKPLGSRVDRHAHIGRGHIGLDAFKWICSRKDFAQIPKILETAKEPAPDGRPWDLVNLELLRAFAAGKDAKIKVFRKPTAKSTTKRQMPRRKNKHP